MLRKWLTFHMDEHSPLSQHLNGHSCSHSQFRQILVKNTSKLHKNNKQKIKNTKSHLYNRIKDQYR